MLQKNLATMKLLLLLLFHLFHLSFALNQEGLRLLDAKRGLYDPNDFLADWNPRDATPCNWTGVSCSPAPTPASDDVVTSIDLSLSNLASPFPAALCRLPFLANISLHENFINSSLSGSSLHPCQSLSHLDLSINNLVGFLPDALASLPTLIFLDLSGNNFTGPIPPSFGTFRRLKKLSLVNNLLTNINKKEMRMEVYRQ